MLVFTFYVYRHFYSYVQDRTPPSGHKPVIQRAGGKIGRNPATPSERAIRARIALIFFANHTLSQDILWFA